MHFKTTAYFLTLLATAGLISQQALSWPRKREVTAYK